MNEPLIVLADAHHLPGQPKSWEFFLNLLEKLPQSATLISLGDFFDIWYRPLKDHRADYKELLDALEQATSRGITMHFIGGNRDFLFANEDAQALGIKLHQEPFVHLVEDKKIGFIHGDVLLTEDVAYQRFRIWIRSRPVSWMVRNLPQIIIDPLVKNLRKQTNQKKALKPLDTFKIDSHEAQKYIEQVDELICGHTHIPEIINLKKGHLRVLPAFGENGKHLRRNPGEDWVLTL